MSASEHPESAGPRPVSFGRAALHGLIPVGVVVAIGAALAAAGKVADPERFGEGLGRFIVFVWLIGAGISWLSQTGRRTAAMVAGGLLAAGGVALVVVAITGGPRGGPEPMTEAERAPLERVAGTAGAELRHPTLGFAMTDPGPQFQPLSGPEAAQMSGLMASIPEQHTYAYVAPAAGQALVILVAKGVSEEADLEGLTQGLREGFESQMSGTILRDEMVWDEAHQEAWFEGDVPGQAFLEVHTVAAPLGSPAEPFAVSVMAVTRERGALSNVLQSLRTH